MKLKKYVGFENFVIPIDEVSEISIKDLDEFYLEGNCFDKFNLFFILLNEYHYISGLTPARNKELSVVCHLISYYLFVLATPPASLNLAQVYAEKALEYYESPQNIEWIEMVKKGN